MRQKIYWCVVAVLLSALGVVVQQVCLQRTNAVGNYRSHSGTNGTPAPVSSPTPPVNRPAVGHVSGTIFFKNFKSDIYLECKSFEVEARQVGGSQELLGKVMAYGDLGKKACRYSIGAIPAGTAFQLIVPKPAAMNGRCTQEDFSADGTLPITLKSQQKLFRNITVRNISCTVLK